MELIKATQPQTPNIHLLSEGFRSYLNARREILELFINRHMGLKECIKVQKCHVLKDLVRNLLNALWAIPYLSIRKSLEVSEKLGWETARNLLPKIPPAIKTDFQKEMERLITVELLGLSQGEKTQSLLADSLGITTTSVKQQEIEQLVFEVETDIRAEIADYCTKQNGTNDLVASGAILLVADFFFGDRSLDVFGLGRKFAGLWAKDVAASDFFLGETLGGVLYSIVPPDPTSGQVFIATTVTLLLLALFSTVTGVFWFAMQKRLGIRKKQLDKLITSIEDKLFLKLAKIITPTSMK